MRLTKLHVMIDKINGERTRLDIVFWSCLILAQVHDNIWWKGVFALGAVACFFVERDAAKRQAALTNVIIKEGTQ